MIPEKGTDRLFKFKASFHFKSFAMKFAFNKNVQLVRKKPSVTIFTDTYKSDPIIFLF